MMKLPSLSIGGTALSASSVAVTYPGPFGSRVGGVGRGRCACACGGGVGVCGGAGGVCAAATPAMTPRTIEMVSSLMEALSTREREGVQRIAGADDDELAAVEHVGDRRVRRCGVQAGVPQRIAGCRIVGDEVSRSIAAEE